MMGYAPSEGKLFSTERVVLLSSIYKRKATQKKNYDRNYYCDCNYVPCIKVALKGYESKHI